MENDQQYPSPAPDTHPEQQYAGPSHAVRRAAGQRKKRLLLIIIGAVVALAIAAGAVWYFVLRDKKTDKPAQTNTATQQQQQEDLPAATASDATPVPFKSTKLNIEVTHRKDWTLKEATTGELTLTSPRISYTRVDGSAGTGVFTLKIRKNVTEAMKTTIDKAVAVRDSEVIAYADPTDAQRYYTNVSYAGQEAAFNFFIVTGSTEIKDGKPFMYQLVFDNDTFLIAGGYGTDKDGTLSFDAVPKAGYESEALTQALDIVKSIKIY